MIILQLNKQEKLAAENNLKESLSTKSFSTETLKDYEEVIQKFEGDIRKHIRIEQQMKLHSESLQQKIEDKEKEIDKINKGITTLKNDFISEKKLLNKIIEKQDKELCDKKKLIEMQSKEIIHLDHDVHAPNTAKSYIDIRKNSNKSKLDQSNIK
jgi:hypothetical protein